MKKDLKIELINSCVFILTYLLVLMLIGETVRTRDLIVSSIIYAICRICKPSPNKYNSNSTTSHIAQIIIGIVTLLLMVAYSFRPMTMASIYDEPNFKAIVQETYETSMLVKLVYDDPKAPGVLDQVVVPLETKLKDSITTFNVGDVVRVYNDGIILDTYPKQLKTVYAILGPLKNVD